MRLWRWRELGPLAGVPFAVKNLFDVPGLPTLAGSKINRDRRPPARDAPLIARLEAAGAVLVGALNMGEYAYDFTGENIHDGAVAQSARPDAAWPAAPPAARAPRSAAAWCRSRSAPTPTARSACRRRSAAFSASSRPTAGCRAHALSVRRQPRSSRPVRPLRARPRARLRRDAGLRSPTTRPAPTGRSSRTPRSITASTVLRIAVAGGYFRKALPEAREAVARVATALGATTRIEIPEAARARAAAYVITTAEGAALHLDRLRRARATSIRPCATA